MGFCAGRKYIRFVNNFSSESNDLNIIATVHRTIPRYTFIPSAVSQLTTHGMHCHDNSSPYGGNVISDDWHVRDEMLLKQSKYSPREFCCVDVSASSAYSTEMILICLQPLSRLFCAQGLKCPYYDTKFPEVILGKVLAVWEMALLTWLRMPRHM